jgi:kinesin family member 6/9
MVDLLAPPENIGVQVK